MNKELCLAFVCLLLAVVIGCSQPGGGSTTPTTPVTPTTLASGLNSPLGIAVDSNSVYWAEAMGNAVKKVPTGGGTVTALASGLNIPQNVAVDSTSVYWRPQAMQ
jgi:hypothetical protein